MGVSILRTRDVNIHVIRQKFNSSKINDYSSFFLIFHFYHPLTKKLHMYHFLESGPQYTSGYVCQLEKTETFGTKWLLKRRVTFVTFNRQRWVILTSLFKKVWKYGVQTHIDLGWSQLNYMINLGIFDPHHVTFDLPPIKKPQISYGDYHFLRGMEPEMICARIFDLEKELRMANNETEALREEVKSSKRKSCLVS